MKKLFFIIFTTLLISCESKIKNEKKNTYEIVSLLYERLAKPIEPLFPPPPPNNSDKPFTFKDSARIDSLIEKIKIERNKKLIVAVYPFYNPYKNGHHKYYMKDSSEFNNVMNKLIEIKDSLKIDIDKIKSKRNDSIIYFRKELLNEYSRDFYKFDLLISFSRISFNNNYTKAVIASSVSTSTLAGGSILYFLEKIDDNWKIKYTKDLSIS